MCSYLTERLSVHGSATGRAGWFAVTDAMVYFDHPVHSSMDHTCNIDFLAPTEGPSARVGIELDASSARALAAAILKALDAGTTPHA